MKLGERIAAKYADDLVVLSETERNYFLQKYDRASILIPNAIRFYEKRPCNLIREKYGLKQGEYILYVGRISPEKGTLDLVEGYRKAKTGKKLVLVGPLDDSEYCRAVQQQAQDDQRGCPENPFEHENHHYSLCARGHEYAPEQTPHKRCKKV